MRIKPTADYCSPASKRFLPAADFGAADFDWRNSSRALELCL
jgi:hypothetical protein